MVLVEVTTQQFNVELNIAYATKDNVTGKPIYARSGCYLHRDAVPLLQAAIDLAGDLGLRFLIFDAFRPTEAQWVLWNHSPNPEFVSDPRRGSPHSRGLAIDLTLIDKDNRPLDMGTPFDDFTSASHHGDRSISAEAQRNRAILLGIMTAAGWDFFRNEWWHYQLFQPRAYPALSDSVLAEPMMPPGK